MTDLHTATIIADADLSDTDELPIRLGGTAGLLRLTLAKLKLYLSAAKVLVPIGGATNQVLAKNSASDDDTVWKTLVGVPAAGTSGQVLQKNSATDYDFTWVTPSSSSATPNSVTWNNGGAGAASGSTFNGSAAITVSYNTIGAQAASALLSAYAGAPWAAGVQVPTLTAANTIALKTVGAAAGNLLDRASGDSLYQPTGAYLTANQTITVAGDASGSGSTAITLTIAAGAVSLAKMANLAATSIIGNNTGSAATPIALTAAQVTAMLSTFTTTLKGLVPAPATVNGYFLRDDGTWDAASGSSMSETLDTDVWTGTDSTKYVSARRLYTSNAEVAVTYATTITLDGTTGLNFGITPLTGNLTLANPTGFTSGRSGLLFLTQDATGSRTATFGTNWKFPGGAPTLSTAANAVDIISYYVRSNGTIVCSIVKALS